MTSLPPPYPYIYHPINVINLPLKTVIFILTILLPSPFSSQEFSSPTTKHVALCCHFLHRLCDISLTIFADFVSKKRRSYATSTYANDSPRRSENMTGIRVTWRPRILCFLQFVVMRQAKNFPAAYVNCIFIKIPVFFEVKLNIHILMICFSQVSNRFYRRRKSEREKVPRNVSKEVT